MTHLTPEQVAEIKARHEVECVDEFDIAIRAQAGPTHRYTNAFNDRAALLSHIESDGWQTMETAPRDENVLLVTSGGWVGEARFELMHDQTWDWIWASGAIVHENHKPLGWRPLPAPPETKE